MAAPMRTTREQWIDAGLRALADEGIGSVRVEVLAARLGVTKGGFYGHFRDRAEFFDALLDEWERRSTEAVVARAEAVGTDPVARLREAGESTFDIDLHRTDIAVRAWAEQDERIAERVQRIDRGRLGFMRAVFASFLSDEDEIDARATLMLALSHARYALSIAPTGILPRSAIVSAAERLFRP